MRCQIRERLMSAANLNDTMICIHIGILFFFLKQKVLVFVEIGVEDVLTAFELLCEVDVTLRTDHFE